MSSSLLYPDEIRRWQTGSWFLSFACPKERNQRKSAPDSDSRSVEREGAQAAARNTRKRGAIAAAPAPQASLTVSRQPLLRRPSDTLCSSPSRAAAQLARSAARPRAQTVLAGAPYSDSRSVEREGAQKAAFEIINCGLCGCSRPRRYALPCRSRLPASLRYSAAQKGLKNNNYKPR
jgi:hypothetical protein